MSIKDNINITNITGTENATNSTDADTPKGGNAEAGTGDNAKGTAIGGAGAATGDNAKSPTTGEANSGNTDSTNTNNDMNDIIKNEGAIDKDCQSPALSDAELNSYLNIDNDNSPRIFGLVAIQISAFLKNGPGAVDPLTIFLGDTQFTERFKKHLGEINGSPYYRIDEGFKNRAYDLWNEISLTKYASETNKIPSFLYSYNAKSGTSDNAINTEIRFVFLGDEEFEEFQSNDLYSYGINGKIIDTLRKCDRSKNRDESCYKVAKTCKSFKKDLLIGAYMDGADAFPFSQKKEIEKYTHTKTSSRKLRQEAIYEKVKAINNLPYVKTYLYAYGTSTNMENILPVATKSNFPFNVYVKDPAELANNPKLSAQRQLLLEKTNKHVYDKVTKAEEVIFKDCIQIGLSSFNAAKNQTLDLDNFIEVRVQTSEFNCSTSLPKKVGISCGNMTQDSVHNSLFQANGGELSLSDSGISSGAVYSGTTILGVPVSGEIRKDLTVNNCSSYARSAEKEFIMTGAFKIPPQAQTYLKNNTNIEIFFGSGNDSASSNITLTEPVYLKYWSKKNKSALLSNLTLNSGYFRSATIERYTIKSASIENATIDGISVSNITNVSEDAIDANTLFQFFKASFQATGNLKSHEALSIMSLTDYDKIEIKAAGGSRIVGPLKFTLKSRIYVRCGDEKINFTALKSADFSEFEIIDREIITGYIYNAVANGDYSIPGQGIKIENSIIRDNSREKCKMVTGIIGNALLLTGISDSNGSELVLENYNKISIRLANALFPLITLYDRIAVVYNSSKSINGIALKNATSITNYTIRSDNKAGKLQIVYGDFSGGFTNNDIEIQGKGKIKGHQINNSQVIVEEIKEAFSNSNGIIDDTNGALPIILKGDKNIEIKPLNLSLTIAAPIYITCGSIKTLDLLKLKDATISKYLINRKTIVSGEVSGKIDGIIKFNSRIIGESVSDCIIVTKALGVLLEDFYNFDDLLGEYTSISLENSGTAKVNIVDADAASFNLTINPIYFRCGADKFEDVILNGGVIKSYKLENKTIKEGYITGGKTKNGAELPNGSKIDENGYIDNCQVTADDRKMAFDKGFELSYPEKTSSIALGNNGTDIVVTFGSEPNKASFVAQLSKQIPITCGFKAVDIVATNGNIVNWKIINKQIVSGSFRKSGSDKSLMISKNGLESCEIAVEKKEQELNTSGEFEHKQYYGPMFLEDSRKGKVSFVNTASYLNIAIDPIDFKCGEHKLSITLAQGTIEGYVVRNTVLVKGDVTSGRTSNGITIPFGSMVVDGSINSCEVFADHYKQLFDDNSTISSLGTASSISLLNENGMDVRVTFGDNNNQTSFVSKLGQTIPVTCGSEIFNVSVTKGSITNWNIAGKKIIAGTLNDGTTSNRVEIAGIINKEGAIENCEVARDDIGQIFNNSKELAKLTYNYKDIKKPIYLQNSTSISVVSNGFDFRTANEKLEQLAFPLTKLDTPIYIACKSVTFENIILEEGVLDDDYEIVKTDLEPTIIKTGRVRQGKSTGEVSITAMTVKDGKIESCNSLGSSIKQMFEQSMRIKSTESSLKYKNLEKGGYEVTVEIEEADKFDTTLQLQSPVYITCGGMKTLDLLKLPDIEISNYVINSKVITSGKAVGVIHGDISVNHDIINQSIENCDLAALILKKSLTNSKNSDTSYTQYTSISLIDANTAKIDIKNSTASFEMGITPTYLECGGSTFVNITLNAGTIKGYEIKNGAIVQGTVDNGAIKNDVALPDGTNIKDSSISSCQVLAAYKKKEFDKLKDMIGEKAKMSLTGTDGKGIRVTFGEDKDQGSFNANLDGTIPITCNSRILNTTVVGGTISDYEIRNGRILKGNIFNALTDKSASINSAKIENWRIENCAIVGEDLGPDEPKDFSDKKISLKDGNIGTVEAENAKSFDIVVPPIYLKCGQYKFDGIGLKSGSIENYRIKDNISVAGNVTNGMTYGEITLPNNSKIEEGYINNCKVVADYQKKMFATQASEISYANTGGHSIPLVDGIKIKVTLGDKENRDSNQGSFDEKLNEPISVTCNSKVFDVEVIEGTITTQWILLNKKITTGIFVNGKTKYGIPIDKAEIKGNKIENCAVVIADKKAEFAASKHLLHKQYYTTSLSGDTVKIALNGTSHSFDVKIKPIYLKCEDDEFKLISGTIKGYDIEQTVKDHNIHNTVTLGNIADGKTIDGVTIFAGIGIKDGYISDCDVFKPLSSGDKKINGKIYLKNDVSVIIAAETEDKKEETEDKVKEYRKGKLKEKVPITCNSVVFHNITLAKATIESGVINMKDWKIAEGIFSNAETSDSTINLPEGEVKDGRIEGCDNITNVMQKTLTGSIFNRIGLITVELNKFEEEVCKKILTEDKAADCADIKKKFSQGIASSAKYFTYIGKYKPNPVENPNPAEKFASNFDAYSFLVVPENAPHVLSDKHKGFLNKLEDNQKSYSSCIADSKSENGIFQCSQEALKKLINTLGDDDRSGYVYVGQNEDLSGESLQTFLDEICKDKQASTTDLSNIECKFVLVDPSSSKEGDQSISPSSSSTVVDAAGGDNDGGGVAIVVGCVLICAAAVIWMTS